MKLLYVVEFAQLNNKSYIYNMLESDYHGKKKHLVWHVWYDPSQHRKTCTMYMAKYFFF